MVRKGKLVETAVCLGVVAAAWFIVRPYLSGRIDKDIEADRAAYVIAQEITKGPDKRMSAKELTDFFTELGATNVPDIRENYEYDWMPEFKRSTVSGENIRLYINGEVVGTTTRERIDDYIARNSQE